MSETREDEPDEGVERDVFPDTSAACIFTCSLFSYKKTRPAFYFLIRMSREKVPARVLGTDGCDGTPWKMEDLRRDGRAQTRRNAARKKEGLGGRVWSQGCSVCGKSFGTTRGHARQAHAPADLCIGRYTSVRAITYAFHSVSHRSCHFCPSRSHGYPLMSLRPLLSLPRAAMSSALNSQP